MPLDVNAAEFREVALRLREAGLVGLRRNMYRNIRVATLPAADRVRASALANLPKAGHLNEWVADAVIKTSITTGIRSAGVTLRARKTGHNLKAIDAGIVRHPTFGNRKAWSTTNVKPRILSGPLVAMKPEVTAACMLAMRQTAVEAGFTPGVL